jgi:hypothetical protein
MAPIPRMLVPDPTLEAVDRALEERAKSEPRRNYLGFSSIGHPCSRKLWYDFHGKHVPEPFDAATLKRFEDGHHGEIVMIRRLRMVRGIQLWTVDPETGRQFRFEDFGGKFAGHMDGAIVGLLQAPATWHVWEHKVAAEKKHAALAKLKIEKGEKSALANWDEIYYAQAILYLDYSGMERHYLTCSTPGARTTISVRTNADPSFAATLKDKAKRIIESNIPLAKISNSPSWFQCKWCPHTKVCHGDAA